MAPRLRMVADKNVTDELRFDDEDFRLALEDDAHADDQISEKLGRGPLARMLGVRLASEYDFTQDIADGWVIHARHAIEGNEEDELSNVGQGKNGKADIVAYNNAFWATWVRGVELPEGATEGWSRQELDVFNGLSSRSLKVRGQSFGKLPTTTRDIFVARLRAHADEESRPAERDPGKAETEMGTWSPPIRSS